MSEFNDEDGALEDTGGPDAGRPRYRPPVGLPVPRENKAPSAIASVAIHVLLILLLVAPIMLAKVLTPEPPVGANGPGPAGGGGGGTLGSGGDPLTERLQYLRMLAPAPATPIPPVVPVPVPVPAIPPPDEQQKPETALPAPAAPAADVAPMPGTRGGTGADGTSGSGPGSGGGVGSGIGTGVGSGVGSGTGGGDAEIFPPTLTQLALLPLPVPGRVRPYTMVASFDVDERGNARLIAFTQSRDGGYNRRIMDMLREIRFRPAVKRDGTPVRDTAVVTAIAP